MATSKRVNPATILVAILLLAAAVFLLRHRIPFDASAFLRQLRLASPLHLAAAVLLIVASYWPRSVRWSLLLAEPVPARRILGSQFIGFTAVALFGRLADLTRPWLIARRLDAPVASQIAVYTIERMFDLGAAAVIFSAALAITPSTTPHHEVFVRAGIVSLAGTAFLALFAVAIRLFADPLAALGARLLRPLSQTFAQAAATRILHFRDGLRALATARQFLLCTAISIGMWLMIGEAYVQTLHSFPQTPELATLPFSRAMLLMAASIGGSVLQLPIVGWFTQIAFTAATMRTFYGAPVEAATACGAVLLFVINLAVVPIGFVFARLEGVTLRAAAQQSATDPGAAKIVSKQ